MAATSSKAQWRAFLVGLVRRHTSNTSDLAECQLTPRQAFAAMSKQFGDDVTGDDRPWIKETLYEVFQIEARKAEQAKRRQNPVHVSSTLLV